MLWLFFLAVFALYAWWHVRENRQLAKQWRNDLNTRSPESLIRFARARSTELLLILACGMIAIGIYDWQLRNARNVAHTPNPPPVASQKPQNAPAPANSGYYPPLVSPSVPAKPSARPASENNKPNASPTLSDVYNPEQESSDNQSVMDDIKKRYEDILVTYLFLKRCGKANAGDYPIITSALAQEMASVNAPGRLQYDIVASAQGSYKEMYAGSKCDGKGIDSLYLQYSDYIKTASGHIAIQ